jgi:glutamate-ammonia-ligase adenylyltransferase
VRLLIVVRLVAPDGMFPPEASRCIVANACCRKVAAVTGTLLDAVRQARQRIAAAWQQVFDEELEIEE